MCLFIDGRKITKNNRQLTYRWPKKLRTAWLYFWNVPLLWIAFSNFRSAPGARYSQKVFILLSSCPSPPSNCAAYWLYTDVCMECSLFLISSADSVRFSLYSSANAGLASNPRPIISPASMGNCSWMRRISSRLFISPL